MHLCGGGYDEVGHKSASLRDLKFTKVDSLRQSIKGGANIILGDFNSDANHHKLGKPLQAQKHYLMTKGWKDKQIEIWNTAPYVYLEDKGCSIVPPEKKTSYFGGTPDVIFYEWRYLDLIKYGMFDMGAINAINQKAGASDHNGIYAKFSVVMGI
jgi:hypothetical protein